MRGRHEGRVLDPDEGEALSFFDTVRTTKATGAETGGRVSFATTLMRAGFGPPLHVHHREDEVFHVLDGEATFVCGDRTWAVGPGATVFLPVGVPHRFTVSPAGPLRALSYSSPAQFEQMVRRVGAPAVSGVLPPVRALDLADVAAGLAEFGVELIDAGPASE